MNAPTNPLSGNDSLAPLAALRKRPPSIAAGADRIIRTSGGIIYRVFKACNKIPLSAMSLIDNKKKFINEYPLSVETS